MSKLKLRRNRGPMIPKGTMHVLEHLPPGGDKREWELWTLANFLECAPPGTETTGFDATANATEQSLAALVAREVGYPVTLTRFEVVTEDDAGRHREPAYYVSPR